MIKVFLGILIFTFSVVVNAAEITTFQYDSDSNDIYELKDGTIFKKTGYGYVGYMGYNAEVIFLEGNIVCMNGNQFSYKLYEVGSKFHYSKSTYTGAEAYAKFEEICGE